MPINQGKGLVRVVRGKEEHWYHVRKAGRSHPNSVIAWEIPDMKSVRVETLAVDDPQFEGQVEQFSVEEINNRKIGPVPADQITHDDIIMWTVVRDRLHESFNNRREQTIVPTTPLRRFYDFLRINPNVALQRCIATGFDIDALKALWDESRTQLGQFHPECPIYGDGDRNALTLGREPLSCTNDLVKRLDDFNHRKIILNNDTLHYIERELNPLRTTQGLLEDGQLASNSGAGGMDLLLVSEEGRPVIGEIKIANDMNPFFALIQALTYAVELSTDHQVKRLEKAFGANFKEHQGTTANVGICLIIARYPDESDKKGFLKITKRLAGELVDNGILFRADILKAEWNGKTISFTPFPI